MTQNFPEFKYSSVVRVGTVKPIIVLDRLTPDEKREVWETLKRNNPLLATFLIDLQKDLIAQQIISKFDCEVAILRSDLNNGNN